MITKTLAAFGAAALLALAACGGDSETSEERDARAAAIVDKVFEDINFTQDDRDDVCFYVENEADADVTKTQIEEAYQDSRFDEESDITPEEFWRAFLDSCH